VGLVGMKVGLMDRLVVVMTHRRRRIALRNLSFRCRRALL